MLLSTSGTRTTPLLHTRDTAPIKSKVALRLTAAQGVDYYSTARTVPTSLHWEGHHRHTNHRTVIDTLYIVITAPRSRYIYMFPYFTHIAFTFQYMLHIYMLSCYFYLFPLSSCKKIFTIRQCDLFIYKMAAGHEEFIETSDKKEEKINENEEVFGILSHLQLGTNTLFTNKEDTNPEHQLFEVVNEHNEVLHIFSPTIKPSHPQVSVSQPDNSPQQDNSPTNENYDYEPPDIPDEMLSNSESESTDTPHYILDSSEEEEELIPQIRIPLKNYPNDTEHEEDL